ncbi:hypothetical protein [Streptomyces orinoci]|uniref:Uncharacterized protein n=1 Tax=Streptomyces orinoci TaxID=67339 RepID=A0ABV3K5S6_STRON|nr:hypothetical protein [Streptomyces orinoci]
MLILVALVFDLAMLLFMVPEQAVRDHARGHRSRTAAAVGTTAAGPFDRLSPKRSPPRLGAVRCWQINSPAS